MTPERWHRIEELYHAARAQPAADRAAFLARACRGDETLRVEVESLLNEPVSNDGFLADPAFPNGAQIVAHMMPVMTDRRMGGYHLQSLLGAGGMGEVYRARDTKLGRDVAIKILPRAFTSDPDRLARFEREARMLAALNHPNICAIYGVEESDGIRFLILELVEGRTLADTLTDAAASAAGAGLPLRTALTIAGQIVDALEVAHEKGIIHRDLKPANIKVTPDGVVKVLDFGLAKATSASAPDLTQGALITQSARRDGALLGTAAYMSPEQTRGKTLDKRTDIWAFGCVLYEMLTGRLAFDGETVSDTIGKILEREPDWSRLPPTTPLPIQRLLRRCLAKDARERLRDIGDVRFEIDGIDEPGFSAPAAPAKRASLTRWLPWVALAALAAAVAVREARRPAELPENVLSHAQFSRFTDWEGTESDAAISPDGRFVTFIADREGKYDIWLSQVGTGRFLNLTKDMPPLDSPNRLIRALGFSGDGSEIWFNPPESRGQRPTRGAPQTEPKLLMPLIGGPPRPFLGEGAEAPSWSADGTRIVFFTNGGGDPLSIADRTGADAHRLLDPKSAAERFLASGVHNHNPVWGPDGQWIYFLHGVDPTEEMSVWRARPSGGAPQQLTEPHGALTRVAALTTQTLLFVGEAEDGSGPWLWNLDMASGVSRRVTSGLEQYTSVSASANGQRVVASVRNPTANLWRVPIVEGRVDDTAVEPYAVPTVRALAPRFGGTSLFYLSSQGSGDGLWRADEGGATEVWSGADGALSEPAAISRDGRNVAVVVRRERRRKLTVMSADGTNMRTLAPDLDVRGASGQGTVDWSPDGAWIVAGGEDAQGQGLFKIPLDGGKPVRLVSGDAVNPVWSPDGTLIVYSGALVAGQSALLAVRPEGTPVDLTDIQVNRGGYRFLPDSRSLLYLPIGASRDFWLFDLTAKTTRQFTHFKSGDSLHVFDVTPDGKQIVFDRQRENSDIVLIDLPK